MTLGYVQANKCAHWFTKRGIPVFPLRQALKTPATTNGFKDATLDPYTIDDWWPTHRTTGTAPNIGVPTGVKFDVIDIDRHGTTNGFDTLARTEWSHLLDLPVHAAVFTANDGLHLYVPHNEASNGSRLAPGIDYRGLGGYVVAPPSVILTGKWSFLKQYEAEPTKLTDTQLDQLGKFIWQTPSTASEH